jgi:hypothetical protein
VEGSGRYAFGLRESCRIDAFPGLSFESVRRVPAEPRAAEPPRELSAPFLSLLIDDCIARGTDYNAGGARYNRSDITPLGIGTLRQAQDAPDQHRDLIVRVAGYSDYFCDLTKPLQDEIIARTEHGSF